MPKISPIPWRDFERVIIGAGCIFVRQEGDHRIYTRADLKRPIILPVDDDVPVFIIRGNMKTLGLSRDEYFRLLHS